jgi:hypothetical protein
LKRLVHLGSKDCVLLFVALDAGERNRNGVLLRRNALMFCKAAFDLADNLAGGRLNILRPDLVFISSPGIGEF